jgi:hypothetical protein
MVSMRCGPRYVTILQKGVWSLSARLVATHPTRVFTAYPPVRPRDSARDLLKDNPAPVRYASEPRISNGHE